MIVEFSPWRLGAYLFLTIAIVASIGYSVAQSPAPNPGHGAGDIGEGTIGGTLTILDNKVGIGNETPQYSLHVEGGIYANATIPYRYYLPQAGEVDSLVYVNPNNDELFIGRNNPELHLRAGGSTGLTVLSNGRIELGGALDLNDNNIAAVGTLNVDTVKATTISATGDLSVPGNKRANCEWTAYLYDSSGALTRYCPNGKYVQGMNCQAGSDCDRFRLYCCDL